MTVSEIVKDLLEHGMITMEAAITLLKADTQTSINNTDRAFRSYYGVPNSRYIFTTTTRSLNTKADKLIKTE